MFVELGLILLIDGQRAVVTEVTLSRVVVIGGHCTDPGLSVLFFLVKHPA